MFILKVTLSGKFFPIKEFYDFTNNLGEIIVNCLISLI